MIQKSHKISPGDQFQLHFVTIFWSGPTIKIQNVALSEGKNRLLPGSGPELAKHFRSLEEDDSPDPPEDPPGGGDKENMEKAL